jgi:hypothetical protein
MNGANAGAVPGGAGGEAPLVYQAWKGNNVSPAPPLYPLLYFLLSVRFIS